MRNCDRPNCLFNRSGCCKNTYVGDDQIKYCSGVYCSYFEDSDGDDDMIERNMDNQ